MSDIYFVLSHNVQIKIIHDFKKYETKNKMKKPKHSVIKASFIYDTDFSMKSLISSVVKPCDPQNFFRSI